MSWTLRPGILTVLLTSFLYPISARSEGAQGRPNILLAIADDWSHDHAGAYGSDWVKTPTFDRIAREGVLFHNAFTSNPKCSPSRASMLTGRNTWQLEEAANHFGVFSAKYRVYPDLLEEAGTSSGTPVRDGARATIKQADSNATRRVRRFRSTGSIVRCSVPVAWITLPTSKHF